MPLSSPDGWTQSNLHVSTLHQHSLSLLDTRSQMHEFTCQCVSSQAVQCGLDHLMCAHKTASISNILKSYTNAYRKWTLKWLQRDIVSQISHQTNEIFMLWFVGFCVSSSCSLTIATWLSDLKVLRVRRWLFFQRFSCRDPRGPCAECSFCLTINAKDTQKYSTETDGNSENSSHRRT